VNNRHATRASPATEQNLGIKFLRTITYVNCHVCHYLFTKEFYSLFLEFINIKIER